MQKQIMLKPNNPENFAKFSRPKNQEKSINSMIFFSDDGTYGPEVFANYSVALEPIFGQIRRLLIQIGGLLILQNGSIRMHLEMGAFWETTSDALQKLCIEISEMKAPKRFKKHHENIINSAKELEFIHKKAFKMKSAKTSDEFEISDLHARLTNILNSLRAVELKSTNSTLVDFRQSCCCSLGTMQCMAC